MSLTRIGLFVLATAATAVLPACQGPPADLIHRPDYPQRIILTWDGDPAQTQAVTWHTGAYDGKAFAEIAAADASPNFRHYARRVKAQTETVPEEPDSGFFHSVTFTGLEPDTLYAYRVGDGETWSAWHQFRTAADEARPFSFIYVGDAQNAILSLWSRTIREAYSDLPEARFIVHAGDLVNRPNSRREWAEWFESAGWVNAMIPSVAAPGNHEYYDVGKGQDKTRRLSRFWRPHFTFPEHGPEGFEESVYYIDFQGLRIISLDSSVKDLPEVGPEAHVEWLEDVLRDNPNRWTIVTLHHPFYATHPSRDNGRLREAWQPLFDKYGVDMVLQGHDHAYGRGHNLPVGQRARDEAGTVYVVSVSGPKMYDVGYDKHDWLDRAAENTQLYQTIRIDGDKLAYRATTVTGELYDAFDLIKEDGRTRLVERMPPAAGVRTRENTLPDPEAPND